jgi:putative addiction module component (TIGR02574 family)
MSLTAIEISKLTVEQRLELIEALWESLREHPEVIPVPDWHREELDRRLGELDRGEVETASWDEVKRGLRDRSR